MSATRIALCMPTLAHSARGEAASLGWRSRLPRARAEATTGLCHGNLTAVAKLLGSGSSRSRSRSPRIQGSLSQDA